METEKKNRYQQEHSALINCAVATPDYNKQTNKRKAKSSQWQGHKKSDRYIHLLNLSPGDQT
jgi:hypothetical protein